MEYKLTREEYIDASWRLVRKRVFIILSIMVMVIYFIALPKGDFKDDLLMHLFPYIIMIVIAIPLSIIMRRKKFGRIYDQQKSFRSTVTLDMNDERMHYVSSRGEYSLPWEDVTRWFENDKFYFIFESSLYAQIIPKRVFSVKEEQFFRTQLTKN